MSGLEKELTSVNGTKRCNFKCLGYSCEGYLQQKYTPTPAIRLSGIILHCCYSCSITTTVHVNVLSQAQRQTWVCRFDGKCITYTVPRARRQHDIQVIRTTALLMASRTSAHFSRVIAQSMFVLSSAEAKKRKIATRRSPAPSARRASKS